VYLKQQESFFQYITAAADFMPLPKAKEQESICSPLASMSKDISKFLFLKT